MKIAGSKEDRQRIHPREVWDAAINDYLHADATASAIERHYGIREPTFRKGLHRRKITKIGKPVALPPSLTDQAVAQAQALAAAQAERAEVPDPVAAERTWRAAAHKAQTPPPGRWATWLFQGGRGAGKTRAGAEWLAERASGRATDVEGDGPKRFALVGATLHDVREVMIEGPSGLMNLPGRERPRFEASRRRLVWEASGAVAYCFSAEEPERLRGPQFAGAWADEFCAWPRPDETLALLRMGLRLGPDPRLVVTTTPKPLAALRRLLAETSCVRTTAAAAATTASTPWCGRSPP